MTNSFATTESHLRLTVIFGELGTHWTLYSQRNALIARLVILNQTRLWAKEDNVIAQQSMKSRSCTKSKYALRTSNPPRVQSIDMQTEIYRSCLRWEETYSRKATCGVRALFFFCRMYFLYPDAHHLPDLASYCPPGQYHVTSPESEPRMMAWD